MKKYIELIDEIKDKIGEGIVKFENKGIFFNAKTENGLLIIDVENDLEHKIKSISFGKVNNLFVTENGEINTVALKGNRGYIENSVEILTLVKNLLNKK